MLISTICPPDIYQDYLSKTLERKVQKVYTQPFFEEMHKIFNEGIPEDRLYSPTSSLTMSKSWLHEMEWLYYMPPVSEEFLNSIKKRSFKVTYKGTLLTSQTKVYL